MLRAQLLSLQAAARDDPRPFLERLAWVDTKQLPGQEPRQRLVFNTAQRRLHDALLTMRGVGLPPRLCCLKARQPGIPTLACGYAAAYATLVPYANTLIISHRDDLSQKLHRKVRAIIDGMAPTIHVRYGTERRGEVALDVARCQDGDVPLQTTVTCATAGVGSADPGRGATHQFVHLSEFAQFPDATATLLGALQAVPLTPRSLVVIESTARGMANPFHTEWLRAESGESGFRPVFIGWPLIDEYRLPLPHDGDRELTPEELDVATRWSVAYPGERPITPEQLWWRRYVIATQCAGMIDLFDQEYPLTAAEAFIVSGLPAFPRDVLTAQYDAMREPATRAFVGEMATGADPPKPVPFRNGCLRRYVEPVASHEYTLGADPSSGIMGGDPAAAVVFDRTVGELVCVWQGHLAPVAFAVVLDALGRYYNEAILAPELNAGHGFSVIEELKMHRYPKLYVWQRVDKVTHSVTNFYGWSTSYRTRPLLIDALRHALAEQTILIRDPATLLELLNFQYLEVGGRAEGQGSHDDLAMATMIAYRVHIEYPIEATGLPPRAPRDLDVTKASDPVVYANNMTKDAWEQTDRDLERMKHGQRGTDWRSYAEGEPDSAKEQLAAW